MALLSTHDDQGGLDSGNTSRRFSTDAPPSPSSEMGAVLDRVFEGVCRPFKVRVEQVLLGQPGVLLAYKLANLLAFYSHTVRHPTPHSAQISWALETRCSPHKSTEGTEDVEGTEGTEAV